MQAYHLKRSGFTFAGIITAVLIDYIRSKILYISSCLDGFNNLLLELFFLSQIIIVIIDLVFAVILTYCALNIFKPRSQKGAFISGVAIVVLFAFIIRT